MEHDTLDPPTDSSGHSAETVVADRVILGVCGLLAERLTIDTLWLRIGFVLLALTGGIGLVVYAALWLMLVAGPRRESRLVTTIGGATLLGVVPLMLANRRFGFISGTLAVVILLVGLTAALWRSDPSRTRRTPEWLSGPVAPATSFPPPSSVTTPAQMQTSLATTNPLGQIDETSPAARAAYAEQTSDRFARHTRPARQTRRTRSLRTQRERSFLGRATFGAAVAVAASGALIDQLNGDRVYPEQWLGAAAAVCGAGLVIGAVRGRGRWLIVPALLFAGAGFVGGTVARFGADDVDAWIADEWISVNGDGVYGSSIRRIGVGSLYASVEAVPPEPVVLELSVGIGSVDVSVNEGVSVRIDADVDTGSVNIDGEARRNGSAGPMVVGPEQPDVTIRARVGIGEIRLRRYSEPALLKPSAFVAESVVINAQGFVNIAGGEARIEPYGRMIFGSTGQTSNGEVLFATSMGEFRYTNGHQLVLPTGETVDLDSIWTELGVWERLNSEDQPGNEG